MNKRIVFTLGFVFVIALLINLIWEFSHSAFYAHYKGGVITNSILFKAAFFDATFITLLAVPMLFVRYLKKRLWVAFLAGVLFAIGLELFALKTGRWVYNDLMPIIPLLKTGLTPTIQLGLISWTVYIFARRFA